MCTVALDRRACVTERVNPLGVAAAAACTRLRRLGPRAVPLPPLALCCSPLRCVLRRV